MPLLPHGNGRRAGWVLATAAVVLLTLGTVTSADNLFVDSDPSAGQRPTATATDFDGNRYQIVAIGTQVWTAGNLRVTHYRDGTAIQHASSDEEWSGVSTGAYCSPAVESPADDHRYGLLYNYHAVADARGLCPEGWHIPTAEEWRTLIEYLGGAALAGGKMKDTDSDAWSISVPGTTNESGFSAIPAGGRGRFGAAGEAGSYATWWSSTSSDSDYAWHWGLHPGKHAIRSNPGHKSSGFSVRCIRNASR